MYKNNETFFYQYWITNSYLKLWKQIHNSTLFQGLCQDNNVKWWIVFKSLKCDNKANLFLEKRIWKDALYKSFKTVIMLSR